MNMKKQVLLFAFTMIGTLGFAQTIPNPGFENWGSSIAGEPQQPIGWVTANLLAAPLIGSGNPTSAVSASAPDNHQGNFSLKLTTVSLVTNPDTNNFPDVLGICFAGSTTFSLAQTPPVKVVPGYPFTSRPQTLSFQAKYSPANGDSAYCYVALTKWNGTSQDIVAEGFDLITGPLSAYTQRSVTLVYDSAFMNTMPDSCQIWFSSSSEDYPQVGSILWVDALAFSGYVGLRDISKESFSLYPNPVTENLQVEVAAHYNRYSIMDVSGKLWQSGGLMSGISRLGVAELPPGAYLLRLESARSAPLQRPFIRQ
jgi:hypothetical protein